MIRISRDLIMLLIILVISGCNLPYPIYHSMLIVDNSIDLSRYPNFLITPIAFNGKYESIGLVEVIVSPGYKKVIVPSAYTNLDNSTRFTTAYFESELDRQEMYDSLYSLTVRLGADAVTFVRENQETQKTNQYQITYYKLSGLAIKRTK